DSRHPRADWGRGTKLCVSCDEYSTICRRRTSRSARIITRSEKSPILDWYKPIPAKSDRGDKSGVSIIEADDRCLRFKGECDFRDRHHKSHNYNARSEPSAYKLGIESVRHGRGHIQHSDSKHDSESTCGCAYH